MSAFLVSHTHISQLVDSYDRYACDPLTDPQAFGLMLLEENCRSLNYRYEEDDFSALEDYAYAAPAYTMTPIEALKAVHCYVYQACERPDYETTPAGIAMQRLEDSLLAVLQAPDLKAAQKLPGYEEAPWGVYEHGRPEVAPVVEDTRPVRYIPIVDVSKMIKSTLKETFPGVKFAVRSDKYAGGSSIRVSWVDGPTHAEVDPILKQFEGSSFDGMIDLKTSHISEYQGERVRFGNDYVFGNRSYTKAFLEQVAHQVTDRLQIPMPEICSYGPESGAYIRDTDTQRYYDPQARAFVELPTLIYREQVQTSAPVVAGKPRVRLAAVARQIA